MGRISDPDFNIVLYELPELPVIEQVDSLKKVV
jgi:hypothetical protein